MYSFFETVKRTGSVDSFVKFITLSQAFVYIFSSLSGSPALSETYLGVGNSIKDSDSLSSDLLAITKFAAADQAMKLVSQPVPINPSSFYEVVTFDGITFACFKAESNDLLPSLMQSRCMPFDASNESFTLGFRDVVFRSIVYSPKYYSSLNDVESQQWLVRQTFSSWYPNISISSGSLLQANSLYTSNYNSTSSGSSNPSVSNTAFQPSTDLSGDSASTSSGSSSSTNPNSSPGLTDPTTTFSSYLQGYPVLTLTWTFLDPTRADKINAAKFSLTSSQQEVESDIRDIAYSTANLYGSILVQEYAIFGYLLQAISAQKLLAIYEKQFEAGLLSLSQIFSQKSELEKIKFNLIFAVSQRDSYVQQLLPLIGLDRTHAQLYFPQLIQFPSSWPLSEKATLRLIERYPSLRALDAQASQMSSLAKSAKKSYLPTLSILAYMTYVGTLGSSSSFPPSQPQGAWSSQFSTYAGLNFTWQMFDGFSQFQQAKSYASQSLSFTNQLEDEFQNLTSQALGDIAFLDRSAAGFDALNLSYESSVSAIVSQLKRSQSGFSDPVASLQAEQALGEVVSSYSSYYERIYGSLMSLLKLTGLNLDQLFNNH